MSLCVINVAYTATIRYYIFGPLLLVGALSLLLVLANVFLAIGLARYVRNEE
jgi:hypothetical protein